jgi:hypothetical protein
MRLDIVLLWGLAGANNPLAVTFGDKDPRLRIAVDFRGTAAGVVPGGRAIVFAGFCDSVTLFRFETRSGSRFLRRKKSGASDCRRKCCADNETPVHKILQFEFCLQSTTGSASTEPATLHERYKPAPNADIPDFPGISQRLISFHVHETNDLYRLSHDIDGSCCVWPAA